MPEIKERPILFSGPMVRAILDGKKTVTRRAVKGVAEKWLVDFSPEFVADKANDLCPYGKPGDRLWVRETFMDLRGTGVEHRPNPESPLQRYVYGADIKPGSSSDEARKDFGLKWKPSIHMPRPACRLLLEVTDVRIERLQDITEEQARNEGIADGGCCSCGSSEPCGCDESAPSAIDSFVHLWNSTGGDWDANPWVWCIEFKRIQP